MILPLSMTVAGSVPLIICVILWMVQRDSFHIPSGLILLKISMFFYLAPIQLLYYILPYPVIGFFRDKELNSQPVRVYYSDKDIGFPYHGNYIWIPRWLVAVLVLWLVCVIIFAAVQIIKYKKARRDLFLLSSRKVAIHGRREHNVLTMRGLDAPYCIGFFKPYVVFPEQTYASEYKEMLYRHEFCHVKNRDSIKKLVCLIIICIHFYNPFAYLLMFTYNTLSEYACDAYAVKHMDTMERKQYAKLIVELASTSSPLPVVWKNGFSNSKTNIKRRITRIMRQEKLSLSRKILVILLCTASVLIGCGTIIAYEPPIKTLMEPQQSVSPGDFEEFVPMGCSSTLIPNDAPLP